MKTETKFPATIEEIEEILRRGDAMDIEIQPDGSIVAKAPGTAKDSLTIKLLAKDVFGPSSY